MRSDPARPPVRTHDAERVLAQARELTEPAYRTVIDALPGGIREVAGYHAGWWDADGHPCESTGKAVRPALVLTCARAAGGPGSVTAAVDAAVAVELVHDFSLLHDDVMDGDVTRRHRPAAWVVFGTSRAILAGDALLAEAMRHLISGDGQRGRPNAAARVLAAAIQELCEGQSADLAFEQRGEVTVGECLVMAERKTGALFGAACELGAAAAGAGEHVASRYREFGRQLGLAFQLTDDLLGIWGDRQVTGKPTGSDLASRKKSLPVAAALSAGTPASDRLSALYQRGKLDEQAITDAARLIEAAGGRGWAQEEARRRVQAASRELHGASPDPGGAADLAALAGLMTGRGQ
jgi:geranylgeranyl diphosphate synthase, type I